jgi:small subunit ribosomal protein S20
VYILIVFLELTVANTKSALKRAEIAERNRLRNKAYKSAVKTLMKKYLNAVEVYAANPTPESNQEVQARLSEAYSKIDKAVKRGVLHPNNGARKKSKLAQRLKPLVQTAQ